MSRQRGKAGGPRVVRGHRSGCTLEVALGAGEKAQGVWCAVAYLALHRLTHASAPLPRSEEGACCPLAPHVLTPLPTAICPQNMGILILIQPYQGSFRLFIWELWKQMSTLAFFFLLGKRHSKIKNTLSFQISLGPYLPQGTEGPMPRVAPCWGAALATGS